MALLGGLAVLVAEAGGDLLPGGSRPACVADELVLAEVEFAALGGDRVDFCQVPGGWLQPWRASTGS